jgi:hypothetical protein
MRDAHAASSADLSNSQVAKAFTTSLSHMYPVAAVAGEKLAARSMRGARNWRNEMGLAGAV